MGKRLLTIVTMLLLISCGKKEDIKETTTTKKNILGTWNVTKVYSKKGIIKATYNIGVSIPLQGELTLKGSDYNMQVSFKENSISNLGSFKINTTIQIEGIPSPKIDPFEISKMPGTNGTWDVKEEKLINTIDDKETSVNIVSYSKEKIVFSYPISEYIDNETINKVNSNIKDVQINGNLFIELTK